MVRFVKCSGFAHLLSPPLPLVGGLRKSLALFLLFCPLLAPAQGYPNAPVKIVVGLAPGGSSDIVTRIMAQELSRRTGKTFVVENKAGAGGRLAISHVLNAPADGYTLLASGSNISILPWLYKNTSFQPLSSFSHIAGFAVDYSAIGVAAASRFKTVDEVLEFARIHPGELTYGSSGTGTPGQLGMELLKARTKVDIRHVPYRGGSQALNDLLGNQVDMIMISAGVQLPHSKGGTIRILAVTGPSRYFALPSVPAIAESVRGYESVTWFGLSGRSGIPPANSKFLEDEIRAALADPSFRRRFEDLGFIPSFMASGEVINHVTKESKEYERIIRENNIASDQ